MGHGGGKDGEGREDVERCREVWCGEEARRRGVVYLEEGVRELDLGGGKSVVVSGSWVFYVGGSGGGRLMVYCLLVFYVAFLKVLQDHVSLFLRTSLFLVFWSQYKPEKQHWKGGGLLKKPVV